MGYVEDAWFRRFKIGPDGFERDLHDKIIARSCMRCNLMTDLRCRYCGAALCLEHLDNHLRRVSCEPLSDDVYYVVELAHGLGNPVHRALVHKRFIGGKPYGSGDGEYDHLGWGRVYQLAVFNFTYEGLIYTDQRKLPVFRALYKIDLGESLVNHPFELG
ncbi:MAG: hypothetical protein KGL39_16500 [Patescibacteria group bacterium]|nr:hypothetical protein [Patescibacteria group bacterium]